MTPRTNLLLYIWPLLQAGKELQQTLTVYEAHQDEPELQALLLSSVQDAEHHVWDELAALVPQWSSGAEQTAA